jgi:hypothetical protein
MTKNQVPANCIRVVRQDCMYGHREVAFRIATSKPLTAEQMASVGRIADEVEGLWQSLDSLPVEAS